ncbi:hypothetical protein LOTGIDRAFT_103505, partial [Lottia gigantea]
INRYNGVTIKSEEQNLEDIPLFVEQLKESLLKWKGEKIRGIWFQVKKQNSALIPSLIEVNFEYHHAQPGYVMLTKWISDTEPNGLPHYANQYIGVGGFVVNDNNELLVIQEKYADRRLWKLPGGHADPGEDLADTGVREVFEETGIKTEFVSLLCFRHQHQYRFDCSDIYFVCLLKPIGGKINPCQQEIAQCTWMNIEEYIKLPDLTETLKHITQCYLNITENGSISITPERINNYNNTCKNNIYSVGHIQL